ncbi:MAG: AAA family ATP:ADP antiporter [Alteromonas naphthalenivorans]|jgi:AAA family ATP:ADP antiporter
MLQSLAQILWGKFKSKDECLKFIRLALIFAFTIGVYWLINPLKDTVFIHVVGKQWLAYAKVFSLCFLFPLLMLYGKLVDMFARHRMFYVICSVYAVGALLFAYALSDPFIGLPNTVAHGGRTIGWLWYAFVESFGSLIVALFWSFVADTSTPDSAKQGFGIIAMGAQFGGVLGPLLGYTMSNSFGPIPIIRMGALGMLIIGYLIYHFMKMTPKSELVGFHSDKKTAAYKKSSPSFFEGIKLIFSQPYLLGIVAIVSLYEIVGTVLELHMKILAAEVLDNGAAMQEFFFKYAICANGVALISLLLGAGAIGRALGLSRTLLLLPMLMGAGVLAVWWMPELWVALTVVVTIKGLNYALNQPAKEQLYIPTTRESKYKAKAWIDSFGSRLSKSVGSSVHMLRPMLQSFFVVVSSGICLGLVGVWIVSALFVADMHKKAIEEDRQIC